MGLMLLFEQPMVAKTAVTIEIGCLQIEALHVSKTANDCLRQRNTGQ
jgi:hypothetical protein